MRYAEIIKLQRQHRLNQKYLTEAYNIVNKGKKVKVGRRHIIALIAHYEGEK